MLSLLTALEASAVSSESILRVLRKCPIQRAITQHQPDVIEHHARFMRRRERLDSVRAVLPTHGETAMHSRKSTSQTRLFALLTVLACTFGPGIAAAASPIHTLVPARLVRFADLNLADAKDIVTLYNRIRDAARAVCLDDSFTGDPAHAKNLRLCIDAVVEQAIRDIDRPALTALHHRKMTRAAG